MSVRAVHFVWMRNGKLVSYHAACGRILTSGLAGFHGAADWENDPKQVTCKKCLKVLGKTRR